MKKELRRIEEERDNAEWVVLGDDDFELVEIGPEIDPTTGKPLPPTTRPDNEGQLMPMGTHLDWQQHALTMRDN